MELVHMELYGTCMFGTLSNLYIRNSMELVRMELVHLELYGTCMYGTCMYGTLWNLYIWNSMELVQGFHKKRIFDFGEP